LHARAILLLQSSAVDDWIALTLALTTAFGFLDDRQLAVAVHDGEVAVLADDRLQVDELHLPLFASLQRRLLRAPAGGCADVARAVGERGTGLADRLCRDDSDRFSHVDDVSARGVASVAHATDAVAGLAGEHGTDLHAFEARLVDRPNLFF